MNLWIALEFIDEGDGNSCTEVIGVFSTEQKAVAACHNSNCMIGPVTLDEIAPNESTEWAGSYYPSERKKRG